MVFQASGNVIWADRNTSPIVQVIIHQIFHGWGGQSMWQIHWRYHSSQYKISTQSINLFWILFCLVNRLCLKTNLGVLGSISFHSLCDIHAVSLPNLSSYALWLAPYFIWHEHAHALCRSLFMIWQEIRDSSSISHNKDETCIGLNYVGQWSFQASSTNLCGLTTLSLELS